MATIRCMLNEAGEISLQNPAIIDQNRVHFFQEMEAAVRGMAANLQDAGVASGDHVAVFMPPSFPALVSIMSLIRCGAVVTPLNTKLPHGQLQEQAELIQCKYVIVDEGVDPALEGVQPLVATELQVYRQAESGRPPIPRYELDQPATITFTSGSTGKAKAAVLSYGNHYYSAVGSNINLHLGPEDKWLLNLPLYHVAGLGILFRCINAGAAIAIPKPGESLGEEIMLYGITHLSLVPTQLYRLLEHADVTTIAQQLKVVLLGGAPVPRARLEEALEAGFNIFATYGMTEMASQVTTLPPFYPASKLGSSGQLLRHRELQISAGGEILVRGRTLFRGYYLNGEIQLPVDEEGWFHTRDLGHLDEEGFLTVLGRMDNMFISGGENIHPEQIERLLCEMLDLEDAVVVPVSDAEFGHRPFAFLKVDDYLPSAEQIQTRLEEFLPRFKIPVRIEPWPHDLPGGLKADRVDLAKRAAILWTDA